MQSDEEKLIQESLLSVRPYLAYPKNLEEKIEKLSQKARNLRDFVEKFEPTIQDTEDPSQRTDCRIFLNDLRKHTS